ncbi:MAG: glycine-rich domain-containing protein-like [Phycisphaerae bacterium]|nr:glycine-rich domain-containing protein-like [Phycisphaerae bacterium]
MTISTDPGPKTQTSYGSIERSFATATATAPCVTRCCDSPIHVDRTLTPAAPGTVVSVDLVRAAERSEDFAHVPRRELERDAADYERFLLLAQRNPDVPLAPTKAIDRMWHLHMLNPRAYYDDCMRLFAEILDHDGGFGSTAEELPVLAATFENTALLWEHEFGVPYVGDAKACTRNCVNRCRRACKTVQAAPPAQFAA